MHLQNCQLDRRPGGSPINLRLCKLVNVDTLPIIEGTGTAFVFMNTDLDRFLVLVDSLISFNSYSPAFYSFHGSEIQDLKLEA